MEIVIGIILVVVFISLVGKGMSRSIGASAEKKRLTANAKQSILALKGEVVDGIVYADSYLDLLPDSLNASEAKKARKSAALLLDQASTIAKASRTEYDLGRSEALLEQAKVQADLCKHHIDLATGGTGLAVSVDGSDYRATPVTANGNASFQPAPVDATGFERIPEEERGACFFCSRPSRISDLTPITIAEKGRRRKVLACANDVRTIQQGAAPAVRSVNEAGRSVPWYQARSYQPYRDYSHNVAYVSYYDSGFWDTLFLASMLSQPYPVYYPIFVGSGGDYTNDMNDSLYQPTYDANWNDSPDYSPASDAGPAGYSTDSYPDDFFGDGGGGDFSSDGNNSGWGDSSGSGDSGYDSNSSESGSYDSGSYDGGGYDSGGGDSGGGDSGGGD